MIYKLSKNITFSSDLDLYIVDLKKGSVLKNSSFAYRSIKKWEVLIAWFDTYNEIPTFKGHCALCGSTQDCDNCILFYSLDEDPITCTETQMWKIMVKSNKFVFDGINHEQALKQGKIWLENAKKFHKWIVKIAIKKNALKPKELIMCKKYKWGE